MYTFHPSLFLDQKLCPDELFILSKIATRDIKEVLSFQQLQQMTNPDNAEEDYKFGKTKLYKCLTSLHKKNLIHKTYSYQNGNRRSGVTYSINPGRYILKVCEQTTPVFSQEKIEIIREQKVISASAFRQRAPTNKETEEDKQTTQQINNQNPVTSNSKEKAIVNRELEGKSFHKDESKWPGKKKRRYFLKEGAVHRIDITTIKGHVIHIGKPDDGKDPKALMLEKVACSVEIFLDFYSLQTGMEYLQICARNIITEDMYAVFSSLYNQCHMAVDKQPCTMLDVLKKFYSVIYNLPAWVEKYHFKPAIIESNLSSILMEISNNKEQRIKESTQRIPSKNNISPSLPHHQSQKEQINPKALALSKCIRENYERYISNSTYNSRYHDLSKDICHQFYHLIETYPNNNCINIRPQIFSDSVAVAIYDEHSIRKTVDTFYQNLRQQEVSAQKAYEICLRYSIHDKTV